MLWSSWKQTWDFIETVDPIPPVSFYYVLVLGSNRSLPSNFYNFLSYTLLWFIVPFIFHNQNYHRRQIPLLYPWATMCVCLYIFPNKADILVSDIDEFSLAFLILAIIIHNMRIHNYINPLIKHHNLQYSGKTRFKSQHSTCLCPREATTQSDKGGDNRAFLHGIINFKKQPFLNDYHNLLYWS